MVGLREVTLLFMMRDLWVIEQAVHRKSWIMS